MLLRYLTYLRSPMRPEYTLKASLHRFAFACDKLGKHSNGQQQFIYIY